MTGRHSVRWFSAETETLRMTERRIGPASDEQRINSDARRSLLPLSCYSDTLHSIPCPTNSHTDRSSKSLRNTSKNIHYVWTTFSVIPRLCLRPLFLALSCPVSCSMSKLRRNIREFAKVAKMKKRSSDNAIQPALYFDAITCYNAQTHA